MMKYTLNDILKIDQYLMNIAAYEVSAGLMKHPDNIDAAMEFSRKTINQFKQFKMMIKNNECTLDELEQMVIRRHGAISDPYSKMSFDEALSAISMEDKDNDMIDTFEGFVQLFIDQLGSNNVAVLKEESVDSTSARDVDKEIDFLRMQKDKDSVEDKPKKKTVRKQKSKTTINDDKGTNCQEEVT